MCGYEFNIAAAVGAIAGAVLGHFYSTSELTPSTIVQWGQASELKPHLWNDDDLWKKMGTPRIGDLPSGVKSEDFAPLSLK